MTIYKSAGIVPIRNLKRPEYLLLKSYGYYDFPKGRLKDNETLLEAALRETHEESGLNNFNFKWGMKVHETSPYKTKVDGKKAKKIAHYFIAEVLDDRVLLMPNPETGIIEHDEFLWLPYDGIIKKLELSPRIRKVLDWARNTIEISK